MPIKPSGRQPDVYVVDDDAAVRRSLCWLVESADHLAAEFADAESLLDGFAPEAPCCVVTDVRMPGMGGLSLMDEIVHTNRFVPVVVITAHGDIQMAVKAMKDGAFDFVEKPFDDKALLAVIERAIDESRNRHSLRAQDQDLWERLGRLTPREQEVLDRLIDGHSNKMVAEQLGISDKTVEAHRAHIMEKMDATSFADLISRVIKARLSDGSRD